MKEQKVGRPRYLDRASDDLDAAIEKLGDVRVTRDQVVALNTVYELLLATQDALETARLGKAA